MYYEINVALRGRHFFATAERSLTYHLDALAALKVFQEKFPPAEGYSITVTRISSEGRELPAHELESM